MTLRFLSEILNSGGTKQRNSKEKRARDALHHQEDLACWTAGWGFLVLGQLTEEWHPLLLYYPLSESLLCCLHFAPKWLSIMSDRILITWIPLPLYILYSLFIPYSISHPNLHPAKLFNTVYQQFCMR